MNFEPCTLAKCIFQEDPLMGGYPVLPPKPPSIKMVGGSAGKEGEEGTNRFKDLTIPIGLVLYSGEEDFIPPFVKKINKTNDTIPDDLFENLFTKIQHKRPASKKTRKNMPSVKN